MRNRPSQLTMDRRLWHKVAALSGMAAVGLGAYGTHAFKPTNPTYKQMLCCRLPHCLKTQSTMTAPFDGFAFIASR